MAFNASMLIIATEMIAKSILINLSFPFPLQNFPANSSIANATQTKTNITSISIPLKFNYFWINKYKQLFIITKRELNIPVTKATFYGISI